jgi:hypothetical protein
VSLFLPSLSTSVLTFFFFPAMQVNLFYCNYFRLANVLYHKVAPGLTQCRKPGRTPSTRRKLPPMLFKL